MVLGEVSIGTNDVIGLAEFYRKILKITLENNSDENKNEIHQVIINKGTGLTIHYTGEIESNNESICLAFTVDDVDE
jgi:predicted enzyme related to lactoylglutathione lyase